MCVHGVKPHWIFPEEYLHTVHDNVSYSLIPGWQNAMWILIPVNSIICSVKMICVENDTPTWGDLIISADWEPAAKNALTIYLIDSLWLTQLGTSFQSQNPQQHREIAQGWVQDFLCCLRVNKWPKRCSQPVLIPRPSQINTVPQPFVSHPYAIGTPFGMRQRRTMFNVPAACRYRSRWQMYFLRQESSEKGTG